MKQKSKIETKKKKDKTTEKCLTLKELHEFFRNKELIHSKDNKDKGKEFVIKEDDKKKEWRDDYESLIIH